MMRRSSIAITFAACAFVAHAAIAGDAEQAAPPSSDSGGGTDVVATPVGATVGAVGTTTSSSAIEKVKAILGQQPGDARVDAASGPESPVGSPVGSSQSMGLPGMQAPSTAVGGGGAAAAVAPPGTLAKGAGTTEGTGAVVPATNQLVGTAAGAVPNTGRPYYLRGVAQLRMLAISDDTPENDRSMIWALEGGFKLLPKGAVFARVGVLQRFVAEEGESAFAFRDMVLGFKYTYDAPLGLIGFEDKTLRITHVLNTFLPTSRVSQQQDLYFAPEAVTRVSYQINEAFSAEMNLGFQYRFHEFAERAGEQGGMNRQLQLGTAFTLDYIAYESKDVGAIDCGAEVFWTWRKAYASREQFQSEASSEVFWSQEFGWGLFASYSPNNWLAATVSLEQNAPVLRDGIVNTRFANRDDTELVFTLSTQY